MHRESICSSFPLCASTFSPSDPLGDSSLTQVKNHSDGKQTEQLYLPMEHPGPTFIRLRDVIFRQKPRTASCEGNAINPALTCTGLFHGGHENKIPWDQLQFIIVLGGVRIDHLQSLGRNRSTNE